MNILSKEEFVKYINFLHFQSSFFDDNEYPNYYRGILNKLRQSFPPEDGFCEIEFYIQNNFGKPSSESEHETPEELYNRLKNNGRRNLERHT